MIKILRIHSITLFILMVFCCGSMLTVNAQNRNQSKKNSEVREIPKVPYSIEVGPDSGEKGVNVILAVGAATIIKLPEPGLQTIFGNSGEGIGKDEAKPGNNDIYLRPQRAGIVTNLIIETQSAQIVLYLKTIEPSPGPLVGQYTGEVIIRLKNVDSDIQRYRTGITQEVGKLKSRVQEIQQKADERIKTSRDQSENDLLQTLDSALSRSDIRLQAETLNGKVKISQIGRSVKIASGYVLLFVVENRSSQDITIDDIQIRSGRIRSRLQSVKHIPPRTESKVPVIITVDSQADTTIVPGQLNFSINNTSVGVRFDM